MLARFSVVLLVLLVELVPVRAADSTQPLSRIAFGSCAQQDRAQPIWDAIVAARPELFLFIGDLVYGDTEDMEVLRAKYQKLASLPGYQKLLKTCPVLATWDDHDLGANDAGTDYPKKEESQQILLDFLGVPKGSPRRKQPGIYDAHIYGPPGKRVQVILTDSRYFRSPLKQKPRGTFNPAEGGYLPTTDPAATFLGDAQWKWLEAQLRKPAELRLLVSSIQVVPEDHGFEKWTNIPHERDRLFKLLRDTQANGVVVLSGDRHLAELSVMDAGIGYPLYDLTSSGLNQAFKRWRKQEVNRHRVASMNFGNNFGLVTIDWDQADPLVRLQIRDEDGEVTIQQKLPLSLLQPGMLTAKTDTATPRLVSGEPLTAAEIKKRLNENVALVMKVQNIGPARITTRAFLNSADDFRDEHNFTVVLEKDALAHFRKSSDDKLKEHFVGKTIRVNGKLSLFRERPQIVVDDPKQVETVQPEKE